MALESVTVPEAANGKDVAVDTVNQGAGDKQLQVVKIALGPDGVLQLLLAAGQAAMALSLPVALASDQSPIPVVFSGQQLTANQGAASGSQKWLVTLPDALPAGANLLGGVGLDFQRGAVSGTTSLNQQLAADDFVTTPGESALGLAAIGVVCESDQNSALDGLKIEQSFDGSTWRTTDAFDVRAGAPLFETVGLIAQFYRVRYTNGPVDQAQAMHLQVVRRPISFPFPRRLSSTGSFRVSSDTGQLLCGLKEDVDTTPAPLSGAFLPCNEVLVQSDHDNLVDVYVGNADVQHLRLKRGNSPKIPCSNLQDVYVVTLSGTATVRWVAI